VSTLASCGRLSAIVPDLANRPRQLVFLTPIDSQLNDFLNEILPWNPSKVAALAELLSPSNTAGEIDERSPSTLKQGHVRFGFASETEPSALERKRVSLNLKSED
jgi:hypothetical protein